MPPVVVFVGAPGAGKSTIAAEVAKRLGLTHLDTDTLVEQHSGLTVSDVFVAEGEAAFRKRERAAVEQALGTVETVLSLGGGAILDAETRNDLASQRVAWLQVSLTDAATRAGLNQARPLLLGNVRATLAKLLDERTPLYAAVADQQFDTSTHTAHEVVEEVLAWLHSEPHSGSERLVTSEDSQAAS